ncbi:MAG: hypothetical protein FWD12_04870 [Alphaproteobacteria bacterium]|nr:hypothetical protein [Alphaproteobacteria bacterium]
METGARLPARCSIVPGAGRRRATDAPLSLQVVHFLAAEVLSRELAERPLSPQSIGTEDDQQPQAREPRDLLALPKPTE